MHIRHSDRLELEQSHLRTGRPWVADVCESLRWLPEHPNGRVLIVEEDGEPRAVLGLEMIWATGGRLVRATIRVLAVDPEHGQRGFGSRLVRFAEGIARINGCRRVLVAQPLERWTCGHCWGLLGYDDPGAGLEKTLRSPIENGCA
jgi:GNAT superfamily N-acetyltransferase